MSNNKKKLVILGAAIGGAALLVFTVIFVTLFTLIRLHVICLNHEWQSAICTRPQTCVYCSKTEGEAAGHTWLEATCTQGRTCSVCKITQGEPKGHTWTEATCTKAKTCSVCFETKGTAMGHHWVEATCTEAKHCSSCSATEGKVLDHSWLDATCTAPMTCSMCGKTDGDALEHTWLNATCTEAKICSVCSATEGSPLGHSIEKYVIHYPVDEYYYEEGICTVCGVTDSQQTCTYASFISEGEFVFTCTELMERINNELDQISGCELTSDISYVDGEPFGAVWDSDGSAVSVVVFSDPDETILTDENSNPAIIVAFGENPEAFADVLWALVGACDPTLDFEGVRSVCIAVLNSNETVERDGFTLYTYNYNGIDYQYSLESDSWTIYADISAEAL